MLPLSRGSYSDRPARLDPPQIPAVARSLSLRGALGPYERLKRSIAFMLNTMDCVCIDRPLCWADKGPVFPQADVSLRQMRTAGARVTKLTPNTLR